MDMVTLTPQNFRAINAKWFIPWKDEEQANTLVITIGDSWTFGDSLGQIFKTHNEDLPARQTQTYGRHIANYFEADWYNEGTCGGSNIDIAEAARRSAKLIEKYKNIYMFVTLTESTREGREVQEVLHGFANDYKIHSETAGESTLGFMRFCEQCEIDLFRQLQRELPTVNIVLARNFTVSYKETNYGNLIHAPKNWVALNYEELNNEQVLDELQCTGGVTMMVLDYLKTLKKRNDICGDYKDYIIEQVDYTDKLIWWLKNNQLHYDAASCHPKAEAHKLWADYLVTFI